MKTIGLIGGLSWESTASYYALLNQGVRARLGGLHSAKLLLWSFDFADIAALQARGDWARATSEMEAAGAALARGGAELLLICANTMHKMAEAVAAASGLPLVHIADATAAAIVKRGLHRPLLLATAYTMEADFYTERLRRAGLDPLLPEPAERAEVHRVIYDELCRGVISPASRAIYLEIIAHARARGADSVIFGCTEIGLLLDPETAGLPAFDTTAIHADAALDLALARD